MRLCCLRSSPISSASKKRIPKPTRTSSAVDLLKVVQERGVERIAAERCAVANHDKLPPSTRERHVHTAGVGKKANVAFAIGPNQRNNDCFLFTPLEAIHRID